MTAKQTSTCTPGWSTL